MQVDDSILKLASEVGRLSGVIEGHSKRLEDATDNMKNKIDKPTAENIVAYAISSHVEKLHGECPRESNAPEVQPVEVRISPETWKLIKRIVLIVGSTGLGGTGLWTIIQRVIEGLG